MDYYFNVCCIILTFYPTKENPLVHLYHIILQTLCQYLNCNELVSESHYLKLPDDEMKAVSFEILDEIIHIPSTV